MNAKVFINYRREDTAPYAGRLYDLLTAHFGEDQVFIDIDKIEPGEDFVEAINRKVGTCDTAIVAIGPHWLDATDASGKRRLDDEEDFVRMEILAALQRNIRVIPVLVGGAKMPRKQDLPEALAPLSRRNAIELSETRFHADVNRLIEAIEKSLAVVEKKTEPAKSAETLITTFIRFMRLNWLVLISLLGAVMMIPRFYLAAITLAPNWQGLATKYLKEHTSQLNWAAWANSVTHQWDIGLTILLAVGFTLLAVAIAYAIIYVPSIGYARYSQRRFPCFLWFRQVPLLLASLILAAWWALFRNVHGSEPFQPGEWLPKFILFAVVSYLSGGLLASIFLLIRKDSDDARPSRIIDSFLRTGIVLTAAFAGVCLWAMASRIFFFPAGNALNYVFFAEALLLAGLLLANFLLLTSLARRVAKDEDRESWGRSFRDSFLRFDATVFTVAFAGFCLWAMATQLFLFPSGTDFVLNRDCKTIEPANQDPKPWFRTSPYLSFKLPAGTKFVKISGSAGASLAENEFVLKHDCKAIEIPSEQETTLPAYGHVRFAGEDLTAVQPVLVPAPARHALNYVCFAPALILGVLMLVNFHFTGLASSVTKDEDRESWGRSAAWILIPIFGWIVFNVMVLWGAQAITATTTGNQLQVFYGQVSANPLAKAILGALGGVTVMVSVLLAIRSKLSNKFGEKAGFQWLLIVMAVVFFVLLFIVISWVLLLIASQPWFQEIIARPGVGKTRQGERLFVIFFLDAVLLLFGIVIVFFINVNQRV